MHSDSSLNSGIGLSRSVILASSAYVVPAASSSRADDLPIPCHNPRIPNGAERKRYFGGRVPA